jgi:hypothetical protein
MYIELSKPGDKVELVAFNISEAALRSRKFDGCNVAVLPIEWLVPGSACRIAAGW